MTTPLLVVRLALVLTNELHEMLVLLLPDGARLPAVLQTLRSLLLCAQLRQLLLLLQQDYVSGL
jgi:hypothetical protein